MAEAAKTTTPRRRRPSGTTAAKTTATKPAAASRAKKDPMTEVTFSLAKIGDTKGRAHFDQSTDINGNDTGCVAKFYAPLGTMEVRVTLVGPASVVVPDDAPDEE